MNPETPFIPTPDALTADAQFSAFLKETPLTNHVVSLHDCDADGVTAGVVWQRGMERLGYGDLQRVLPDRERRAWSPESRRRVGEARPDRLFVLDLGSEPIPVAEGVPTCLVDHHRPSGVPDGDTLISAYTWDPIPCTSLLVYDLLRVVTNIDDLDWIAAIGAMSDLGDSAPFDVLQSAKKRYTAKYLKEATTLINAARRCAEYIPNIAAEALLASTSPRELVESDGPLTSRLREAHVEVAAELQIAKKAAPVFTDKVALVRVHSACQVHPLIATIWRTRLPKHIVVVANDRFMPNRVNFSIRSSPGVSILDFLAGIDIPPGEGHFGFGHDQASNGSLPPDRWHALLLGMGFTDEILNARTWRGKRA